MSTKPVGFGKLKTRHSPSSEHFENFCKYLLIMDAEPSISHLDIGEKIHVCVACLGNIYCTLQNSLFSLKTSSEDRNEDIIGTEQERLLLRKALLLYHARDAVCVLPGNPPSSCLFLKGFPVKRLSSSLE